jgi:Ca2+-binding RTX toxin-like protein
VAIVKGTAGNDTLTGTADIDTLYGLGGNDIYFIDQRDDLVIEDASAGFDRVYTTLAWYTLTDNVEDLIYYGPANASFAGTGNALSNRLVGGDYHDILDGKGGADRMYGGKGYDLYRVDNVGDQIFEDPSTDWDIVYSELAYYKLGANLEGLRYVGGSAAFTGIGNDLVNTISSGDGDDILDGGGDGDLLAGNKGNDTYLVDHPGDTVEEKEGSGVDDVRVNGINTYTLPANVERLFFDGTGTFWATGNALDNTLVGGWSPDRLDGGLGADRMEGRASGDTYIVDNAGDLVIEAAGEGSDAVWTSLSAYQLPANVESMRYTGDPSAAFAGTGNGLDNYIESSDGDDVLDGGVGADQLVGRGGDDVYHVDNVGDYVTEDPFGGVDEVRTALGSRSDPAQMYILPTNVENLTGTSAGAQGVYGNALDNRIRMGSGGDLIVLHDGGNDSVESGGGSDFVYFGGAFTGEDTVDGGAGIDTVGLLGNYDLTLGVFSLVGVEKLALYSSGVPYDGGYSYAIETVDENVAAGQKLTVIAQSLGLNETLTFDGSAETDGSFDLKGGRGADTITGGAGNDIIWGNVGADSLKGGAGKDVFVYQSAAESNGEWRDLILDFAAGDRIALGGIDADSNATNGDSKFAFIGSEAFHWVAGELRVTQDAVHTRAWLVEADTNGDGAADFSLYVVAQLGQVIGASDFLL